MNRNSAKEDIISFLRFLRNVHVSNMKNNDPDWFYQGPADLLLRHGRWFKTKRQPSWVRTERGQLTYCFRNSALTAIRRNLRYVEGYAAGIIPTHHA